MARPTTRTAVVDVYGMKRVCGTATQAFKCLEVADTVSYWVFLRAWDGDAVTPAAAKAITEGWRDFLARMQDAPRESATGG